MINVRDHSKFSVSLSPTFARAFTILKMKLVLAFCLLLSLVGVSQQFIPGLGHLKLGLLGGAKLGLLKSQLKSTTVHYSSSLWLVGKSLQQRANAKHNSKRCNAKQSAAKIAWVKQVVNTEA